MYSFYIMGEDERFRILSELLTTAQENEADFIIPPVGSPLRGSEVIRYFDDLEYIVKNADITAEGTIFLLMQELDRTISGRSVTVVGSGRIARLLAYKLSALGAAVTVAARNESEREMLKAFGIKAVPIDRAAGDIVLNTVPERILELDNFRKGAILVELASSPGGFDPEEAKERGMRVITARGLPAKYAPRSAAEAILASVKKQLRRRDTRE